MGLLPSKSFTADLKQEIKSIRKLSELDFDTIYFGHDKLVTHNARQTISQFADKMGKQYKNLL